MNIPANKFESVSLAAKPITTLKIPADATQPVRSISQLKNIKYTAPPKMAIFPILSNRGMVLFCINFLVSPAFDDHFINSINILKTANDHTITVIDLKVPSKRNNNESGMETAFIEKDSPRKNTQ